MVCVLTCAKSDIKGGWWFHFELFNQSKYWCLINCITKNGNMQINEDTYISILCSSMVNIAIAILI